jgi:hypothetical protein
MSEPQTMPFFQAFQGCTWDNSSEDGYTKTAGRGTQKPTHDASIFCDKVPSGAGVAIMGCALR